MASKRNDPTKVANVRVGNYRQDVDTTGMGGEFDSIFGTPLSKEENDYVKSQGTASSKEAVRRARKANKQLPPSFPGE